MKKIKMARGVTLTFEEGCNKYLENCRQRNLREGTNFAYVRLVNCFLDDHINSAGFDDWGKTEALTTVRFYEERSFGTGAFGNRPDFVRVN